MSKICCFGEPLMRVSPPQGWIAQNRFQVYIGGAEVNVATALANWGLPVKYCTAMPDTYIGRDIGAYLASRQIDISAIAWQGDRMGLYYMQQGADLKHAGVVYDRFYSSFYELQPGDIDWDRVLEDVTWFHFTAISPALNATVALVCRQALEAAKAKGITISVDLNYRSRLWQYGKAPSAVMPELVQYCDIVMGNIWAAHTLLGTSLDKQVEATDRKESYLEHTLRTSSEIRARFPSCRTIAYTFRFDAPPSGIRYYAALDHQDGLYVSEEFATEQVVDKAGSGDCFMAGLIYGLMQQAGAQQIIDFAASAAFGKLQETGDASNQRLEDVWRRIR